MAERIDIVHVHIPPDAPVIAPSLIAEFDRKYVPFVEQLAAGAEDSELFGSNAQELTGGSFSSVCDTVSVGHQTEEYPLSFEDIASFEEPLLSVGESSEQHEQNKPRFHLSSREEVEQLSIKQVPPEDPGKHKMGNILF